jgi:cytochrome c biogenesis protein CcmG/thiol:disulfide interchange protein DsbE
MSARPRLGMACALCSPKSVLFQMSNRLRSGRALRLLALCGALLAATCVKAQDSRPVIRFVKSPEAAPEIHVQTLDGKPLTLASANGKVILLNFWATWCGPCRMEIPGLIELQKQYKDSLQIMSLLVDVDDVDDARKFVADAELNYPVAVATNDVRLQYGGVSALPTVFVIDTQGRIVQKHVGLFDPRLYELETRALLNLTIPVRVETFEDTGEIFLKNAKNATELPGVDLAALNADQKMAALHALNASGCTCGCTLTLAQCRIYDSACATSKARAEQIVSDVSAKKPSNYVQPPPRSAPADKSPNTSPGTSPQ